LREGKGSTTSRTSTSSWPARETFSFLKTEVSKSSEGMAASGAATTAAATSRAARTRAGWETGNATTEEARVLGAAGRVLGWPKARAEAVAEVYAAMSQAGQRSAGVAASEWVVGGGV
jgi:hypothetical protein